MFFKTIGTNFTRFFFPCSKKLEVLIHDNKCAVDGVVKSIDEISDKARDNMLRAIVPSYERRKKDRLRQYL
jgi:hypothetical protein